MSTYADTSFLVSLYVLDANSALAANQIKQAKLPILLTPFGELELANALFLRLFRKELVPSKVKAAYALLRSDIEGGVFQLKPLSARVYERAKQIARRRTPQLGTRTLDVLHVASAVLLQADTFFTFDRDQGKLARAEGLRVIRNSSAWLNKASAKVRTLAQVRFQELREDSRTERTVGYQPLQRFLSRQKKQGLSG